MIRIVGIQRHDHPNREFVLLQNQGSLRIDVKGHLLLSEDALEHGDLSDSAFLFTEEAVIAPGNYVLLSTGIGEPRWAKTKDGAVVYYAYMNREAPFWAERPGPLHLLRRQHTYKVCPEPVLIR